MGCQWCCADKWSITHLELVLLTARAGQTLALDVALNCAEGMQNHFLEVLSLPGAALACHLANTARVVEHVALHAVATLKPATELADGRQQVVLGPLELLQQCDISGASCQDSLGEPLQCAGRVLECREGGAA